MTELLPKDQWVNYMEEDEVEKYDEDHLTELKHFKMQGLLESRLKALQNLLEQGFSCIDI